MLPGGFAQNSKSTHGSEWFVQLLSTWTPPSTRKSVVITAIALDHPDELRAFDIEKTIDPKAQKLWFP
jgi:hypothetical protein